MQSSTSANDPSVDDPVFESVEEAADFWSKREAEQVIYAKTNVDRKGRKVSYIQ